MFEQYGYFPCFKRSKRYKEINMNKSIERENKKREVKVQGGYVRGEKYTMFQELHMAKIEK